MQVTQLLHSWSEGNQGALEKLTPLIYAELHRLARGYMRRERGKRVKKQGRSASFSERSSEIQILL
jgi:hypothetical protein